MTTTPQAALLTQQEVEDFGWRFAVVDAEAVRAIEQAVLAKLQPAQADHVPETGKMMATQAEPVQAGELPELPEPFALSVSVHEGDTPEKTYAECMLYQKHPNEKQKLYTADQMNAYARAALAARKPLMDEEIDAAVLEATGFDGIGIQAMNQFDCRNIVHAALSIHTVPKQHEAYSRHLDMDTPELEVSEISAGFSDLICNQNSKPYDFDSFLEGANFAERKIRERAHDINGLEVKP